MLLTLPPSLRIYAAVGPTDLRKGFDGLAALATSVVGADPVSGHLFLFLNRKRTQVRVLFWDGTGFCIFAKRLAQGTFQLPAISADARSLEIDHDTLRLILAGVDLGSARWRKRFRHAPRSAA